MKTMIKNWIVFWLSTFFTLFICFISYATITSFWTNTWELEVTTNSILSADNWNKLLWNFEYLKTTIDEYAEWWTSSEFPSGFSIFTMWNTCPTWWTKNTTHNDKALRLVSWTPWSWGNSAFSTVFWKTATDSHTLTIAQIPSHSHFISANSSSSNSNLTASNQVSLIGANYDYWWYIITWTNTSASIGRSSAVGGWGAHSHNMDLRVQYVDVIICTKD